MRIGSSLTFSFNLSLPFLQFYFLLVDFCLQIFKWLLSQALHDLLDPSWHG